MPLIEPERTHSTKVLLFVGIPSFILALLVSLIVHQYARDVVRIHLCNGESEKRISFIKQPPALSSGIGCPWAAAAGISATLILALVAFGMFVHFPRNLMFASLAFINATARLPDAITLFSQYVLNAKAKLANDEQAALGLLHFKDPTAYFVILLFYILCLFFFTVIIIQDAKVVKWKWLVAIASFIAAEPLRRWLSDYVAALIA